MSSLSPADHTLPLLPGDLDKDQATKTPISLVLIRGTWRSHEAWSVWCVVENNKKGQDIGDLGLGSIFGGPH